MTKNAVPWKGTRGKSSHLPIHGGVTCKGSHISRRSSRWAPHCSASLPVPSSPNLGRGQALASLHLYSTSASLFTQTEPTAVFLTTLTLFLWLWVVPQKLLEPAPSVPSASNFFQQFHLLKNIYFPKVFLFFCLFVCLFVCWGVFFIIIILASILGKINPSAL